MRPTIPSAVLSLCLAAAAAAQQGGRRGAPAQPRQDPKPPAKIPARFRVGLPVDPKLALEDLAGKVHRLGDYRGKVVVLHFWSTRCPWVRISDPKMVALAKRYAKNPKVVFLAVDSNRTELVPAPRAAEAAGGRRGRPVYAELVRVAKARGLPYPVLVDPGNVAADRFQALTTPHCFVIDGRGILRYSGAFDDDQRGRKAPEQVRHYLADAIEAVLAGREVAVPKTRPYGCTIKRVRRRPARRAPETPLRRRRG